MLNMPTSPLLKMRSMSFKEEFSIIVPSVSIFPPPATGVTQVTQVDLVVVVEAEVVSAGGEVAPVVEEDVAEVVLVQLPHSRGRRLHSKPCFSGTFLLTRATVGFVGL